MQLQGRHGTVIGSWGETGLSDGRRPTAILAQVAEAKLGAACGVSGVVIRASCRRCFPR
jgi:hypothetical protein